MFFFNKKVFRVVKATINPYMKFISAQKMLCYGVYASAFVEYFQARKRHAGKVLLSWCRCWSIDVPWWKFTQENQ
jgi:hypothetical protein